MKRTLTLTIFPLLVFAIINALPFFGIWLIRLAFPEFTINDSFITWQITCLIISLFGAIWTFLLLDDFI